MSNEPQDTYEYGGVTVEEFFEQVEENWQQHLQEEKEAKGELWSAFMLFIVVPIAVIQVLSGLF